MSKNALETLLTTFVQNTPSLQAAADLARLYCTETDNYPDDMMANTATGIVTLRWGKTQQDFPTAS